eukprot:Anaeramoba_ignava/a607960_29.p1 GENE.a607960_29~~a607960_29.p1  ORF type:complete len:502 (-),score=182.32 a607960_29:15-1331(-)
MISFLFEKDEQIPKLKPITKFEYETSFPEKIHELLINKKWSEPTPIQAQGWPTILSGYDFIGISPTGSGKTLTFVLPAITHILSQPPLNQGKGPIVVIITPIRNLAIQIHKDCESFGNCLNIRSICIYGGISIQTQIEQIKAGAEILVSTPGRLADFIDKDIISLERVTYFVLDEVDRMLDFGFKPEVRKIVNEIRPERQTLMFSATLTREILEFSTEILQHLAIKCNIGKSRYKTGKVTQIVEVIDESEKLKKLLELLPKIQTYQKIIIFTETISKTDELTNILRKEGYVCLGIHSGKGRREREWILSEFTKGNNSMLVATDVAEHLLDSLSVNYLINYDFPVSIESYSYRVDKTSSLGKKGVSHSFFTPELYIQAKSLIEILKKSNQAIPQELIQLIPMNPKVTKSFTFNKKYYHNQNQNPNTVPIRNLNLNQNQN